jgi:hypothetical protein
MHSKYMTSHQTHTQSSQLSLYICYVPFKLICILIRLAWNTLLKHVTPSCYARSCSVSCFLVPARLRPQDLFLMPCDWIPTGLTLALPMCLSTRVFRSTFIILYMLVLPHHLCSVYMLPHLYNSYHSMLFLNCSSQHEFLTSHKAHKIQSNPHILKHILYIS